LGIVSITKRPRVGGGGVYSALAGTAGRALPEKPRHARLRAGAGVECSPVAPGPQCRSGRVSFASTAVEETIEVRTCFC